MMMMWELWGGRTAMDFARLTLGVGVDKDGAAALAEGFGKFRSKLMAGDDFDVLAGESRGSRRLACQPNASSLRSGLP